MDVIYGSVKVLSTFVLIHGSWHGAWCWYKVIPSLEDTGHRVIAPDLPSLGRDKTPTSSVSAHMWAESVCRILDKEAEPVVLVGHSRGGMVISQVAEALPSKVSLLVYLCAFLLGDGESVMPTAQPGGRRESPTTLIVNEEHGWVTVRPEAIRSVFYGACSDEDVALARLLLQPEALLPLKTPIHLTPGRFGRIPRVYIECLRDNALGLDLQRQMHRRLPCQRVLSIDTDHSPFFSAPSELIAQLGSLVEL